MPFEVQLLEVIHQGFENMDFLEVVDLEDWKNKFCLTCSIEFGPWKILFMKGLIICGFYFINKFVEMLIAYYFPRRVNNDNI